MIIEKDEMIIEKEEIIQQNEQNMGQLVREIDEGMLLKEEETEGLHAYIDDLENQIGEE